MLQPSPNLLIVYVNPDTFVETHNAYKNQGSLWVLHEQAAQCDHMCVRVGFVALTDCQYTVNLVQWSWNWNTSLSWHQKQQHTHAIHGATTTTRKYLLDVCMQSVCSCNVDPFNLLSVYLCFQYCNLVQKQWAIHGSVCISYYTIIHGSVCISLLYCKRYT